MYNKYKDQQTGRRSETSFHENPHETPAVPADVLKTNSSSHWNLPRLNPLPYGGYLGEQHASNQIIQDGHFSSCTSRPSNTNQRIIRPTARVNCQPNINAPYYNHTPRAPHQWNLAPENTGSVVCKTAPQFAGTDPRSNSGVVGNGIDFSRYPRDSTSLHRNVPTYKDASGAQERHTNQATGSELSAKKDVVFDRQVNIMPHQTSCKYPVLGQLPLNMPHPTMAGHWANNNQQQPDFWPLNNDSRQMMGMDGNSIQMPSKYWLPKKNDVGSNRHDPSSRLQDVYNYEVAFQHQKTTEKMKQFQDNVGKDQLDAMDWSHEAIRSGSNIMQPYNLGRYPDNRNSSHSSQGIGPHPPMLSLDSYSHSKHQPTYDSPQLHSRLTGHSAYPMTKVSKGSYFDPQIHSAHSKNYSVLNLDNQSVHLGSGVPNLQSYMNPAMNSACNEMYAGGGFGQSMQVVDNPCLAGTKPATGYEQDVQHLYGNMLHQNSNNVPGNMFYENKISKANGYNPYYTSNVANSQNALSYNMIPQNNVGIPTVKPQHSLATLEMIGGSSQPVKKRKLLVEESLDSASNWATVTKSNEKAPILDVRHFLSTWDEDEESDVVQPDLPLSSSELRPNDKQSELFVLDCTSVQKTDAPETRELLGNTKSQGLEIIQLYKADENKQNHSAVIKPVKDCQTPSERMHTKHHYKSLQQLPVTKNCDAENLSSPILDSHTRSDSNECEINTKSIPVASDDVSKLSFADTVVSLVDIPQKVSDKIPSITSAEVDAHPPLKPLLPIEETLTSEELATDATSVPKLSLDSQLEVIPIQKAIDQITDLQTQQSNPVTCTELDIIPSLIEIKQSDYVAPMIDDSPSMLNHASDNIPELLVKMPEKTPESVIKYIASDAPSEECKTIPSIDQELLAVDLSCRSLNTSDTEDSLCDSTKELPMPMLEPISNVLMNESDNFSEDETSTKLSVKVNGKTKNVSAFSNTSMPSCSSPTEIEAPDQSSEFEMELHASYDGSYFRNDSSKNSSQPRPELSEESIFNSPNKEKIRPESLIDYIKCAEKKYKARFPAKKSWGSSLKLRSVRILNRHKRVKTSEDHRLELVSQSSIDLERIKLSLPFAKESSSATTDSSMEHNTVEECTTDKEETVKSSELLATDLKETYIASVQDTNASIGKLNQDIATQSSCDSIDEKSVTSDTPGQVQNTSTDADEHKIEECCETLNCASLVVCMPGKERVTVLAENTEADLTTSVAGVEEMSRSKEMESSTIDSSETTDTNESSVDDSYPDGDQVEELNLSKESTSVEETENNDNISPASEIDLTLSNCQTNFSRSNSSQIDETAESTDGLPVKINESQVNLILSLDREKNIEEATLLELVDQASKEKNDQQTASMQIEEKSNSQIEGESQIEDDKKQTNDCHNNSLQDIIGNFDNNITREISNESSGDDMDVDVELCDSNVVRAEVEISDNVINSSFKEVLKDTVDILDQEVHKLVGEENDCIAERRAQVTDKVDCHRKIERVAAIEELVTSNGFNLEPDQSKDDIDNKEPTLCEESQLLNEELGKVELRRESLNLEVGTSLLDEELNSDKTVSAEEESNEEVNSIEEPSGDEYFSVDKENPEDKESIEEVIDLNAEKHTEGEEHISERGNLLDEESSEELLDIGMDEPAASEEYNFEREKLVDEELCEEMQDFDSDEHLSKESDVGKVDTVSDVLSENVLDLNCSASQANDDTFENLEEDVCVSSPAAQDSLAEISCGCDVELEIHSGSLAPTTNCNIFHGDKSDYSSGHSDVDVGSEGDLCPQYSESLCISQHSDSQSSDEESGCEELLPDVRSEFSSTAADCTDEDMPALEVITKVPPNNSELLEMPQLELMAVDSNTAADTINSSPLKNNVVEFPSCELEQDDCEHKSWPCNVVERPESANRIESMHNWPYLEEEVCSETPKSVSPVIETTCSGKIHSPGQNCLQELELPSSTDVPSQIHSIDSSSEENEITHLKCRLSWDKIFNLSKTNGSQSKTSLSGQWSCVKSNLDGSKISLKKGFQQLYHHDETDPELDGDFGLELGPAKIQVRLTHKPLVPEQWQVIDGPKTDSVSSLSFGEENNNSEIDSRSMESINIKSPIVMVKRIILKRRAEDSHAASNLSTQQQCDVRHSVNSSESDDSSSSQRSLPKVVIKRTRHGKMKYQSFLRTQEIEEKQWQPVVRLERRKSIEDLVAKLCSKNEDVFVTNTTSFDQQMSVDEIVAPSLDDEVSSSNVTNLPDGSLEHFSHYSTVNTHSKEEIQSQNQQCSEKAVTGINCKVKNGRIETSLVTFSQEKVHSTLTSENIQECEVMQKSVKSIPKELESEVIDITSPQKKRGAKWKRRQRDMKVTRRFYQQEFRPSNKNQMKTNQKEEKEVVELQSCLACNVKFANDRERSKHIMTHAYHCQRCNMAFKSQLDFEDHLSEIHPHTKELHHCLLCKLCFTSAGDHQRHLSDREHRRLDLTQRWTIQRLFLLFSGSRCSRLAPFTDEETAEMTTLSDAEPGAINYYHQATPLQLAEQDFRENVLPAISQGLSTKSSEKNLQLQSFETE